MEPWLSNHSVEIFGAVTGILYVFLEIRQNILLWPLGIVTSAVYMYVFRENGFYAGMALQGYYLLISIYGWWAWKHGSDNKAGTKERGESGEENHSFLKVRRLDTKTAIVCLSATSGLFILLWFGLDRWTDSQVPFWDAIITSLSVIATWMLTRKILEQWHVWIAANTIAVIVYLAAGMYPTAVLFFVYDLMAIAGLREWKKGLMCQIDKL